MVMTSRQIEVVDAHKIQLERDSERVTGGTRVLALGHSLFAVGLIGLGMLSLGSGDFAYSWQPVPPWVPWRTALAYLSGLILVITAIGVLVRRWARPATQVIGLYLLVLLLALHLTRVLYSPGDLGRWLGLAENLALVCGAWILVCLLPLSTPRAELKVWQKVRFPQMLFAAACVVLGLSHFVYLEVTAGMVPAWLPYRIGFAYLTGAGHFAAGVAILLMIIPGVAATLEASMISSFVLLLHIPAVVADPRSRLQWTMLCVASALAGSAWILAGSLQKEMLIRSIRMTEPSHSGASDEIRIA